MTKRALVALLACLAVAAVVAGCGGGGDSTSSGSGGESSEASEAAPTKAAFIKEADGICRTADNELNEDIESYAKENGISLEEEPTKEQQVEIYEAVVLPNVKGQGDDIAALTPPEGEEEAVEQIVDALNEGVEEAEADPEQLVEGDNPLAAASSKAKAYGMKVCGSEE